VVKLKGCREVLRPLRSVFVTAFTFLPKPAEMSSEESPPATTTASEVDTSADKTDASRKVVADVVEDVARDGEEDHEDPLVIDEAEDKSDGGDSDEKVS
jgi:hypothetical protein